jgi:hypothetical protein
LFSYISQFTITMRKPIPYWLRGRYAQINENDKHRFFEIHTCEYSPEAVQRLKEIDCLEESILGQYMRLVNSEIPDDTCHLYKLHTYIGNPNLEDFEEFVFSSTEFEQKGFLTIEDLLACCNTRWGLTKSDFKPIYETNIPY